MKRITGIAGLIVLFAIRNYAQTLTATTALNFGTVTEITPDSIQVTITNTTGNTVSITGYRFYNTYGSPAFSTSAAPVSIPNGGNQTIWVKFLPKHNIAHNSELIILNNGKRGPLRVNLLGQGHYSNTYYNQSENLEEEALKTELHTITGNNYNQLGYSNAARDFMFMTLDNKMANGQGATQNTLECVYTGREAIGYIDRVDCQTTFSFNTEHTFPQSFFSSNEPMKSDLFHLFPTDDNANNVRANYPFGMVANPSWTQGGSKFGNNIFEPRDVHKGIVARAMLYFVMRYQNYSNFLDTQESILKQWHSQFPPTAVEITRCNAIYSQQQNRNPFIDYPQLVDRITSFSNTSVAPVNYSMDLVDGTVDFGTITSGISYTYQYLVVNNGNQPLHYTNFNLSTPQLNFVAPFTGNDTIIQPGEALQVFVSLNAAQAGLISENFQYNTDDPAHATVVVPVFANALASGFADIRRPGGYTVYPNPFSNRICIEPAISEKAIIKLYDLQGRMLETTTGNIQSCIDFSQKVQAGTYVLEISNGEMTERKIIISE